MKTIMYNGQNNLQNITMHSISKPTTNVNNVSVNVSDKQKLNSMNGDRISYCKDTINPYFNNEKIRSLIEEIISIHDTATDKRVDTVLKSLTHIIDNNLNFTLFPQYEYFFNTDKFIDSLKDFKNFKYFSLYSLLIPVFKKASKKIVATDKCEEKVNKFFLNKDNLFAYNESVKYLSIKICGRLLNEEESILCESYIKNEDSNSLIEYMQSLKDDDMVESKFNDYVNSLGRKPTVLIMIAFLETQNAYFLEKMLYHIHRVKETNQDIDISFALESERISKENTDYTPWSRVKRIRNFMIEKYPIHDYDYLYIIDSDIIDYPHDFIKRSISLNPTGITAPVALIQYSNVFYDWCGFQKKDATTLNSIYKNDILKKMSTERNFNLLPPYVEDDSTLVELDCVGCTYVIPSKVFKYSYTNKKELIDVFDLAKVKNHKINEYVQYEDHPSFTDHYTVCAALKQNGGKIYMDRGSVAYHADLPLYGEEWH
jgi:hypothetical protein